MHYATSRKVAGSSPDAVDFFNVPNPPSRIMALRSTQPLTEMSTRIFLGVKGGRRIGLATLRPSVSRLSGQNVGPSTSHNPMDFHGLLQGQLYLFLPFCVLILLSFGASFCFTNPDYRLIRMTSPQN
jgi:hypothetical protein